LRNKYLMEVVALWSRLRVLIRLDVAVGETRLFIYPSLFMTKAGGPRFVV